MHRPRDTRWTDFVGDLSAVVAATEYTDYAIVAHSLGVAIALSYASRRPAGLAGLILGDYGPHYPLLGESWVRGMEGRFRRFASWEDADKLSSHSRLRQGFMDTIILIAIAVMTLAVLGYDGLRDGARWEQRHRDPTDSPN